MLHALIPFKGRIDRLMNIGESCNKSKARCMTFFSFPKAQLLVKGFDLLGGVHKIDQVKFISVFNFRAFFQ